MNGKQFTCPACGFGGLTEPPWHEGSPSFEICPCCGLQFGYSDATGGQVERRPALYERWGRKWHDAGMSWSSPTPPLAGWDAETQWKSLERAEQARIEATSVRALLEAACPGLGAVFESDDDPEHERLLYAEMGAAARSLGADYLAGKTDCLRALFAAVDHLIAQGTPATVSLVVVGLLEQLQNQNVTKVPEDTVWEPYLGSRSRGAWLALKTASASDPSALQRWATDEGIELL